MAGIKPLSATAVGQVQGADRTRVSRALAGILPLTTDVWFPRGNGYLPSAHKRITKDNESVPDTRFRSFSQYVAASAFGHCGDAWGFFGRAMSALLLGDLAGAIHLLYYAELRAAISLLAAEGIFIGNRTHLVLTGSGTASTFQKGPGTHTVTWQALQAWADGARPQALLGEMLRPGGERLDDWTSSLTSKAAQAKLEQLIGLMSLDLRRFDQDHERRNTASYSPSRLRPSNIAAEQVRDLVADAWRLLEPGVSGTFPALDEALLPDILRAIRRAVRPRATSWGSWLSEVAPASQAGGALLAAMIVTGEDANSDGLVGALYMSRASESDPSMFVRPMLARTVVLLRIATGACLVGLVQSGRSGSDLQAWTDSLAYSRGLWDPTSPLGSPTDLWADVEVALDEASAASVSSLHDLLSGLYTGVRIFGQGERVPVWSFA